ncbi:hypothetical protein [Micromonospora psammae]|uniref:hypothetical protein n=1 Tax=Micromonospora sp. CPCC 205556 TaxID=3122398 RepID=UPI002FF20BE5
MIVEPAHRTCRDQRHWRAARRRIRETVAVRRAAAAAGERVVEATVQSTAA